MLINQIKFKLKRSKRVGRGGKRGNYSGRGIKGQKARAGRKIRPALRELVLRLPKRRGLKFRSLMSKPFVVNLRAIEAKFESGEKVTLPALVKHRLIDIPKSLKKPRVKILAGGELTKKLHFDKNLIFSKKAQEKIKQAGSVIE
jgi:large subunit ribosomal protein L15